MKRKSKAITLRPKPKPIRRQLNPVFVIKALLLICALVAVICIWVNGYIWSALIIAISTFIIVLGDLCNIW